MPGNLDFGLSDDFGVALVDTQTGATKPLDEQAAATVAPFERKIDLGDGSGVQVFKGATQDELLDKLTEAQVNATKKIRELSAAKKRELKPDKREPLPEFKPQVLSDHDIASIAQDLSINPDKAWDRLFQAKVGATPDTIARQSMLVNQIYQERQEEQAVTQFMLDHQGDYFPCAENLNEINKFFIAEEIPVTRNNMEYAYTTLRDSGKMKDAPVETEELPDEVSPVQRQLSTPPPVSLSERSSNRNVAATIGSQDVAEISSLPIDKARERIVALMRQGRQS